MAQGCCDGRGCGLCKPGRRIGFLERKFFETWQKLFTNATPDQVAAVQAELERPRRREAIEHTRRQNEAVDE